MYLVGYEQLVFLSRFIVIWRRQWKPYFLVLSYGAHGWFVFIFKLRYHLFWFLFLHVSVPPGHYEMVMWYSCWCFSSFAMYCSVLNFCNSMHAISTDTAQSFCRTSGGSYFILLGIERGLQTNNKEKVYKGHEDRDRPQPLSNIGPTAAASSRQSKSNHHQATFQRQRCLLPSCFLPPHLCTL